MKKQILLFLVMLFLFSFSVFSQENKHPELTEQQQETFNYPDGTIFVINSFVFDVDGITLPFMMIDKADLIKGEEITGFPSLQKYIADKQQLLVNERVLESVKIDYSIGQQNENGKYPVVLVIHVKDTFNFIAIPRPMYSSNSGYDITIKARDYNFLGTMNTLSVDLGYQHDRYGRNFYRFLIDSGIPFEALGLNWFFNFDHYFNYQPDMKKEYYYKNITGLSVLFPIKKTHLLVGHNESFVYNEENPDDYKMKYGEFQEGLYMASNPYITWIIPTGYEIGDYGELTYAAGVASTFFHEFPRWPLADFRKGFLLTFLHNLGFGRVNWIGNLRRGYSASATNLYNYLFKNEFVEDPLTISYSISGEGHFTVTDSFGISSRLMFQHWVNLANASSGGVIRGVLDDDLYADYLLSLNLDLKFRVLRFMPSEWLNNRKFRFFNFELFFGPIMDAALSHDPRKGTIYGFNNLNLTGGFEVVVFPLSFRSLFLRGSIATDAYRMLVSERGPVEIYIGTDLHF